MVEKLCKFSDKSGAKLKSNYGKANKIVSESVDAYFDGRILRRGFSASTVDVSEFLIDGIKSSVKNRAGKGNSYIFNENDARIDSKIVRVAFFIWSDNDLIKVDFIVKRLSNVYFDASVEKVSHDVDFKYKVSISAESLKVVCFAVVDELNG